jgi:hypothetical protein
MTKGAYTRRGSGEMTRDAKRGRLDPGEARILRGMGEKLDKFLKSRGLSPDTKPGNGSWGANISHEPMTIKPATGDGVVTGRALLLDFRGKRFARRGKIERPMSLFVMLFRAAIDDGKRRGVVNPKVDDEEWMAQLEGANKQIDTPVQRGPANF